MCVVNVRRYNLLHLLNILQRAAKQDSSALLCGPLGILPCLILSYACYAHLSVYLPLEKLPRQRRGRFSIVAC